MAMGAKGQGWQELDIDLSGLDDECSSVESGKKGRLSQDLGGPAWTPMASGDIRHPPIGDHVGWSLPDAAFDCLGGGDEEWSRNFDEI